MSHIKYRNNNDSASCLHCVTLACCTSTSSPRLRAVCPPEAPAGSSVKPPRPPPGRRRCSEGSCSETASADEWTATPAKSRAAVHSLPDSSFSNLRKQLVQKLFVSTDTNLLSVSWNRIKHNQQISFSHHALCKGPGIVFMT